jgi:hypothetical protein
MLLNEVHWDHDPPEGVKPLPGVVVVGQVALWGKVIQRERGWRAQYAYPKQLCAFTENDQLATALRERYQVPVVFGTEADALRRLLPRPPAPVRAPVAPAPIKPRFHHQDRPRSHRLGFRVKEANMRRLVGGLAVLLLGGCATAADIKPGIIRGLDDRGYVKTSEGFGIVTRGCPDADLWAAVVETATTLRPSGHAFSYGPLRILSADEGAGTLRAEDPATFWRKGSYVGIFIHRLSEDMRLIEASSFWDTKSVVLKNPWERDLLDELLRRLPCVVPSEQALLRSPGGRVGQGRMPIPAPAVQPAAASEMFCRKRAKGAGSREQWYADYRRCMAGY